METHNLRLEGKVANYAEVGGIRNGKSRTGVANEEHE